MMMTTTNDCNNSKMSVYDFYSKLKTNYNLDKNDRVSIYFNDAKLGDIDCTIDIKPLGVVVYRRNTCDYYMFPWLTCVYVPLNRHNADQVHSYDYRFLMIDPDYMYPTTPIYNIEAGSGEASICDGFLDALEEEYNNK